ncbi:hypothetical protein QO004_003246 [Rhizobium mesoamericanum]|nr:hypothetical protein [Rhizobium mesoamericanum]
MQNIIGYLSLFDVFIIATLLAVFCCGLFDGETS